MTGYMYDVWNEVKLHEEGTDSFEVWTLILISCSRFSFFPKIFPYFHEKENTGIIQHHLYNKRDKIMTEECYVMGRVVVVEVGVG